ncbi:hypothetical protein SEVIR_3G111800v4 [Setaria viridis]
MSSEMEMAGGGVEDAYGEDRATEEQLVTPWAFSVASGYTLLRDPRHNKGLAFSEAERDAHYLRGLLPPALASQELQEKKIMHNLRQYTVPLQRYIAMMDLQERNERLFYKLLIDNVEELLPVVYTPTVGEACQKYGSIYRRPQGLYISLKDKGKILEVLKNWPERSIQVIVVTDGERILGLGDLGCQGMGIPVGKLSLYTALGGVRPSACLPITIDVGTNNETLLNDEFYIGLRQRRATGQEYHELLEEFMTAVKQNYGEKVLTQFEDFANHNAFDLLAKYSKSHLVFNDDIQVGLCMPSSEQPNRGCSVLLCFECADIKRWDCREQPRWSSQVSWRRSRWSVALLLTTPTCSLVPARLELVLLTSLLLRCQNIRRLRSTIAARRSGLWTPRA